MRSARERITRRWRSYSDDSAASSRAVMRVTSRASMASGSGAIPGCISVESTQRGLRPACRFGCAGARAASRNPVDPRATYSTTNPRQAPGALDHGINRRSAREGGAPERKEESMRSQSVPRGFGILRRTGLIAVLGPVPARAASHREAPLMTLDPAADITDFYAFVSYDDANLARSAGNRKVTFILNTVPGQEPGSGPNYF